MYIFILEVLQFLDFRVPDVKRKRLNFFAQLFHPLLTVEDTRCQLVLQFRIAGCIIGPDLYEGLVHGFQVFFFLLEQLVFFPCLFRAEISKGMIDVVIVYHEAEIAFLLGLVFAVHHLCQLLLGYPDFVGIPPSVLDAVQHRYIGQQFGVGRIIVIHLLGAVGGKDIHTDFAFRLITVGSEPSQVVKVVDGIHIVVKGELNGNPILSGFK